MLQIVHDLAPHASLAFATAFKSEESFAQNIERLARPVAAGGAGAQVIVDDVGYFAEPFFQDGPVAAAINKVTAEGVTYLAAAGNDNLFEGNNEIASWEAPEYRDSEGCPKAIEELEGFNGDHCMDFDPGPGRRVGVLVDHLVAGSKESRIADAVRSSPVGAHVLVVGHPFVDVWAAVRPERLGLSAWPFVPRDVEWKHGICAALGWPHADQADGGARLAADPRPGVVLRRLRAGPARAGRGADRLRHRELTGSRRRKS